MTIADALRTHPAVVDAGAVGRPDPRSGEVPVAFVTVSDTGMSEQELIAHAAAHVPESATAPKSVSILASLPVTAVGKPYKPALRLLASRTALSEYLNALGMDVPDNDHWCRDEGGRLRVSLPVPQDDHLHAQVRDLLASVDVDFTLSAQQ